MINMENDFIIYTESYYGPGTFPEKGRRGKKKEVTIKHLVYKKHKMNSNFHSNYKQIINSLTKRQIVKLL